MTVCRLLMLVPLVAACAEPPPGRDVAVSIDTQAAVATVDERFLSVAVDSAQVVGGSFWDPSGTPGTEGEYPVPPYDFDRPKLRRMAQELAPAYLRIGGSAADRLYYDMNETPVAEPPEGYDHVMTRAQWDRIHRFTELDYRVLFTLSAGPATRDDQQAWMPDNARALLEYTAARGYEVELWELGNEVNAYPLIFGVGFNINAEEYTADLATAHALVRELQPESRFGAPSVAFWPEVGEIREMYEDILLAGGGDYLDVITWHYYPQQSRRCPLAVRPAETGLMLDPVNLDEIDVWADFVEGLRDEHAPAAPVWLGETGGAQCGGEPGISDAFEGGFWWLDQLGSLARRGQPVVVRQTLSGSNYGLIDDETLEPNPDYFNSLLWRRFMGQQVLAATSDDPLLRVYAHCAYQRPGAVALLLLNLDPELEARIPVDASWGQDVELYLVTAESLDARDLMLNGEVLAVGPDGAPPPLEPRNPGATIDLPPQSYAFAILPAPPAPTCN